MNRGEAADAMPLIDVGVRGWQKHHRRFGNGKERGDSQLFGVTRTTKRKQPPRV